MSSPIWTPGALASEAVDRAGRAWRLVEAQHRVSTLKLTDSLAEQTLLEGLIEDSKPPLPIACQKLHYLLATPFRYGAVYPVGSRFRRAGRTHGVFYGAERVETAVAEMAFYRLLFFAESPGTPWAAEAKEFTAFAAAFATQAALDLTRPPLDRDGARWSDLVDYTACQALAEAAREGGIEAIFYRSARDPRDGLNVALLDCRVFTDPMPKEPQSWRIRLSAAGVQALREFPPAEIEFDRAAFAADPRLADFRWQR